MIIGNIRCKQIVGYGLLESSTGYLSEKEVSYLWQIFTEIVKTWRNKKLVESRAEEYYGQWHEFIMLNTRQKPSYINEYRNGITVLEELKVMYPTDYWNKLFFENKLNLYFERGETEFDRPDRATRLGHFKLYVIDEFIDVFLTCGGFKQFKKEGKGNYNSYIYQSRYN